MEGVFANAARAWHPDNLPTLLVDGPRTFGTLRTHSVSRRRCVTASKHALQCAHCAAAAAASRRARLGRKQCARGEALPLRSARDIRKHPCPLLPPLPPHHFGLNERVSMWVCIERGEGREGKAGRVTKVCASQSNMNISRLQNSNCSAPNVNHLYRHDTTHDDSSLSVY